MRIAFTADIHLKSNLTPSPILQKAVKAMGAQNPDLVVVAGDIGEPFDNFEKALDTLTSLACPVAILAGNHDVWKSAKHHSRELWEERLPSAVKQRGMIWLEDEVVIRDGIALLGTIAWYDYSARSWEHEGKSDQAFFDTKASFNNDGVYVDWPWNDIEFAAKVGQPFLRRLRGAQDNPAVQSIVVVTHVPIFPAQRVYSANLWDSQGDAYFGNWTLGREVETFSKVRAVVSGHTHMGKPSETRRPDGSVIQCFVVGSDYGSPDFILLDTRQWPA